MNEKQKLLAQVRMYGLSLHDTALFLDSHPKSSAAMTYYKSMKEAYDKALADYVEKYGPMHIGHSTTKDGHWNWIDDPWPWEGADN